MRKYSLYSIVICVLLAGFFLAGCEKDKGKEKEVSLFDTQSTPCTFELHKSQSENIIVEYKDGYLEVTHENATVNCGFTRVDVTFTIEDNIIEITEQEDATDANCICQTDISYKIGPLDSGSYTIIIKLRDKIVYNQIKTF
ncbi:MAG: hypothetical protein LBH82_03975 [Bacteroidales bacterium]|jgi:hypothetical protein|nr:hypothetical protein [Bacteroidales bacterium]